MELVFIRALPVARIGVRVDKVVISSVSFHRYLPPRPCHALTIGWRSLNRQLLSLLFFAQSAFPQDLYLDHVAGVIV
jgi:hypothetical protein